MTYYIAKVYGIAWAGYRANTEYRFEHQPTRAEIVNKAGDFQAVTRISLRKVTTEVKRVKCA